VTDQEVVPLWKQRAQEYLERERAQKTPVFDEDLIPVVGSSSRTEADEAIDRIVDGVDILDAYRRWCGKMDPQVGSKRESIMVSCPKPDHQDSHPSAWINLDKQTWFCGGCNEGGDALDIAAYHFGFPVPGYKEGRNFPDLRRRIAEDFGFSVVRTLGGQTVLVEPESQGLVGIPEPESSGPGEPVRQTGASSAHQEPLGSNDSPSARFDINGKAPFAFPNREQEGESFSDPDSIRAREINPEIILEDSEPASVTDISGLVDMTFASLTAPPSFDWRLLAPDDTFLSSWMRTMEPDDLPNEFYLFLGLTAVGLAVGRDVVLADSPLVRGNLFSCLVGPSGMGKSRAIGMLARLLTEALPFDDGDDDPKGTMLAPSVASAESLVDVFSKPITDPSDPKIITRFGSVRGLVRFDELATLVGRSARTGSVMKPTLMEFYDGYSDVTLRGRGAGLVRAADHFCSALTTTQPKAMRDLLSASDADSGFLNRWVFALGPSKPLVAFGGHRFDLSEPVRRLRSLMSWGAMRRGALPMSAPALAVWEDFFFNEIEPLMVGDDPDPMMSRMSLTMKKIMLLVAVDHMNREITQRDVETAITVFPYLKATYDFVTGNIGFGTFENIHEDVAYVVQVHELKSRQPTLREISKSLWRKHYQSDVVVKVIETMVKLGELQEVVVKPKAGPMTVRYRYVH
jgi:hypothetical protein